MQWLKQSTAATVELGPVADATDGVSEEIGLTTPTVYLSKNGGGFLARNGTSFSHDGFGWYLVGLSATDTNTLGRLSVMMRDPATHLPVWMAFMVVPANVWDSLFGADRLQVDLREIGDANLGLTTQMKADVNAEADTALADYDPPTRAEATADKDALAAFIDTEVAAILEDTGTTLPAQIAGLNNLSAAEVNSEAAAALTAYDPPTKAELDAGLAALNDIAVADILTAQMVESYAPDGTAPTLAQALFQIMQQAGVFSVSGTTITVKKLDGVATAMTFTLDDASNPTSRTRAT